MNIRHRDLRLRIKAVEEDGSFEGYASVFNEIDAFGEQVAPGAFKQNLAERQADGRMPKLLYQHNADWPIGVWRSMAEDKTGLAVTGELNLDTQMGRETRSLLRQGALDGLSIGFVPLKREIDEEEGIVTLTEIDLWETSIVTFPALDSARISAVKHFRAGERPAPSVLERALREAFLMEDDQAKGFMAKGYKGLRGEREVQDEDLDEVRQAAERLLGAFANRTR